MYLTLLKVSGFRNLNNLSLRPAKGVNVIYGSNAQGKTNLIESIWLMTGHKSFRGAKDTETVKFGEEKAQIEVKFFSEERPQSAELLIDRKRTAALNGVGLKSATELCDKVHAVVFSPENLELVKEGPEKRRGFLNTAILGIYGTYNEVHKKYLRALKQRNALLKNTRYMPDVNLLLEEYDIILSQYGSRIVKLRKRYIERLEQYLPKIYDGISAGNESLKIKYISRCGDSPEEILEGLKTSREEDIRSGVTTVGPHRDDISFKLNGKDARIYGSQGQQRSIVLALKMAEAELQREVTGEEPIILLDDVLSELDRNRQEYLLNNIKNRQVFITCCENTVAGRLRVGKTFMISNGKLEKISKKIIKTVEEF